MRDLLGGVWAVALVTWQEAWRQRIWLLLILVAIGLLVGLLQLRAVDDADRLKLAVASITGAIGFVATLLALLLGTAACRRDRDSRVALTLFTKPLPRLGYLLGRWLGVQAWLVAALLLLGSAGVVGILLRLGTLPQPRAAIDAEAWWRVVGGEAVPVDAGRQKLHLRGQPRLGEDQAVRLAWSGLPSDPNGELELLLRAEVLGDSLARGVDRTPVQVSVIDGATPRRLQLHPASPYGQVGDDRATVLLRDRRAHRQDLERDYVRLRLPGALIGEDGRLLVQIDRLRGDKGVALARRGSVLVARPTGHFLTSLAGALAVTAAQAGLLSGLALLLVGFAELPVVLLGGLTVYFAGLALPYLREAVAAARQPGVLHRLLEAYAQVQPDFSRFAVETQLATGHAVAWTTVGGAWLYYGAYTFAALLLAWWSLRRVEW